MTLMLALITLDRSDSVSPLAAERSRRELTGRDCMTQKVVLGGQEIGPSWQRVEAGWHRVEWSRQGGMESKPLG